MISILITDNKILVLMACFNGAKYIQEQIESIQKQTRDDWVLIIRDDGSSDDSIFIINKIIEQDKRIILLKDKYTPTGLAQLNFNYLLKYAQTQKADYIFLSDQDDVWLPNKIESFVTAVKKSNIHDSTPLLVHSDLEVVDHNLDTLSTSLVNSIGLTPNKTNNISALTFQNCVTGCACMINRALLERVIPMPQKVMMHDWWLVLVASAFGKIIFIPDASVKYRQHDNNAVGATSYIALCNPLSKRGLDAIKESKTFIENCYMQIFNLRERLRYEGYDTSGVDAVLNSARLNRLSRIVYLYKGGSFPSDRARALGYIIRHLLTPRDGLVQYAE